MPHAVGGSQVRMRSTMTSDGAFHNTNKTQWSQMAWSVTVKGSP